MSRSAIARIVKGIKEWNELASIPLGLSLFIFSPLLFRAVDGTASVYDIGTLHAVCYGIAAFCVLKGVAWITFKWDFPLFYRWLDDQFETEALCNNTATPASRHRWFAVLSIFFFYFFLLVLLTVSLL